MLNFQFYIFLDSSNFTKKRNWHRWFHFSSLTSSSSSAKPKWPFWAITVIIPCRERPTAKNWSSHWDRLALSWFKSSLSVRVLFTWWCPSRLWCWILKSALLHFLCPSTGAWLARSRPNLARSLFRSSTPSSEEKFRYIIKIYLTNAISNRMASSMTSLRTPIVKIFFDSFERKETKKLTLNFISGVDGCTEKREMRFGC